MKLTPCSKISCGLTDALLIASTVFVDLGVFRTVVRDLDKNMVVKWNKTLKRSFKPAGTRERLGHFSLLDSFQTECKTSNMIYVRPKEKSFISIPRSYVFIVARLLLTGYFL